MVSSKKLPKSNLSKRKETSLLNCLKLFLRDLFLQQKCINPTLLVAYSGGLDSTVLLHALSQLQSQLPMRLHAMHVHHGLSENADDWAVFCEQVCVGLDVPIKIHRAHVNIDSGLGLEATARQARYQALFAEDAHYVCVGHHQDDQAETLLLQLARGSGVKGLAGMAAVDCKRHLLRPLLDISRDAIMAYAKAHQLQWIEDESNADTYFDRNFIRHTLMPTFRQQYPSISQTLARSAAHMAQADHLLTDLAILDADAVLDASHEYGALRLAPLFALSEARQVNLVRWWLAKNDIEMPSQALLVQVLSQLSSKRTDAAIRVKVSHHLFLMRYKTLAFLVGSVEPMPAINMRWQGEESVLLPNGPCLLFKQVKGEGIAYERFVNQSALYIRNRMGGERFLQAANRPRRSLKTLLQSADMPPWLREQLPLIFIDDTLAIVPNVAVNADLQAKSDELGLVVTWQPAANK